MKKLLLLSLALLTLCSCSNENKEKTKITLKDGEKLVVNVQDYYNKYREYSNPSDEQKKFGAEDVEFVLYEKYYTVKYYDCDTFWNGKEYITKGAILRCDYYSSNVPWRIYQ